MTELRDETAACELKQEQTQQAAVGGASVAGGYRGCQSLARSISSDPNAASGCFLPSSFGFNKNVWLPEACLPESPSSLGSDQRRDQRQTPAEPKSSWRSAVSDTAALQHQKLFSNRTFQESRREETWRWKWRWKSLPLPQ